MIVVVGRIRTDDARRAEAIRVGETLVAASRKDAGCIRYGMFASTKDPNELVIIEEWESDDALQAHFRAPHIAEFMGTAPSLLTDPPDVQFHTIESTRDLSNVTSS